MFLINAQNITKEYTTGEVTTKVLRGIDLTIKKGEFVAIMGPSGSGKSTLMHILSFLETASGGSFHFEGKDVSGLSDDELAKKRNKSVGFVFQTFNLLPRTTVTENVKLPLLYNEIDNDHKLAIDAIESVSLTHRRDHMSNQLSGGERQRVAIARAIVNNPTIIFADEPTGNLDSKTGNQILSILQNLNNSGRTIVMVTHERDTAEHANRIVHIRDGKIVSDEKNGHQKKAVEKEFHK
jgi:putative ABC transport system ATP-binding protein